MDYESVKKTLRIFAIIFSLVAVLNVFIGFDKMFNYSSGSGYEEPHNAYVGGDAYNIIINGTYTASYFVLAASFFVSSTICFVAGSIIDGLEVSDRAKREENNRVIAELKRLNSISPSEDRSSDMKLPEL